MKNIKHPLSTISMFDGPSSGRCSRRFQSSQDVLGFLAFLFGVGILPSQSFAAVSDPAIIGNTGSSLASPTPEVSKPAAEAAYEASVIRAKQQEISFTSNCQEWLNKERYAALGNKRKADCAMLSKHPECKTTCEPAPEAATAVTEKPPSVKREEQEVTETYADTPTTRSIQPSVTKTPTKKVAAEEDEEDTPSAETSTPTPRKTASTPAAKPAQTEDSETDTPPKKSKSTASNDSGDGPSSEELAALSKCRSLAAQAGTACQTPDQEDYGATASSIAGGCEQMQNAGIKNGNAKNDAAKACNNAWSECSSTCKDAADKYEDSDNWSVFNGQFTTCLAYSKKVSDLTTASAQSAQASAGGSACDNASSQAPQSAGGDSAQGDAAKASAANAAAVACAANPNSAECAQKSQYAAALASTAGFNQLDTSKGSFDTADTSGLNVNPQMGAESEAGAGGGRDQKRHHRQQHRRRHSRGRRRGRRQRGRG